MPDPLLSLAATASRAGLSVRASVATPGADPPAAAADLVTPAAGAVGLAIAVPPAGNFSMWASTGGTGTSTFDGPSGGMIGTALAVGGKQKAHVTGYGASSYSHPSGGAIVVVAAETTPGASRIWLGRSDAFGSDFIAPGHGFGVSFRMTALDVSDFQVGDSAQRVVVANPVFIPGSDQHWHYLVDGSDHTDGTQIDYATPFAQGTGIALGDGSGNTIDCYVAAILVFDRYLTSQEVADLNTWSATI